MPRVRESKAVHAINLRIDACKVARDKAAADVQAANALLQELLNIRDAFTKAQTRVVKPSKPAAAAAPKE